MRLADAINIEDLHRMAKRRLPKIAFDFIEGGHEDERGLETNIAAFHKHRLLPRYLFDVSKRDQTATLFGHTYASPFGISPTGGAGRRAVECATITYDQLKAGPMPGGANRVRRLPATVGQPALAG
ncbi:MAG: alpha-hydroxy-acid oxidizing protein [Stellaceae bacterium]